VISSKISMSALFSGISRALLIFLFLFTLKSNTAISAELLHMHGDGETFAKFQLQQSCQIIATGVDAHWCNPANLSQNTARVGQAEFGVRADEEGLGVANKTATRKPSKADIENLFRKKNFSAVSGYGRVETILGKFSVSYTPIHLVAAYRVYNPALPEIALLSMEQSVIRADVGSRLRDFDVWGQQFTIDVGSSIYWFDRSVLRVEDQLINISINQDPKIGSREKYSGVDADAGIIIRNNHVWLPEIGLRIDRLLNTDAKQYSLSKIDLTQLLTRRSLASVGKVFDLHLGSIGVESSMFFRDAFQAVDIYQTSLGLQYSLGSLRAFISASPMMESFGFAFQGPFYLLGIQYTDEKQANELQVKRQRMTYVYAKVQI
jgi:hypothetical protein